MVCTWSCSCFGFLIWSRRRQWRSTWTSGFSGGSSLRFRCSRCDVMLGKDSFVSVVLTNSLFSDVVNRCVYGLSFKVCSSSSWRLFHTATHMKNDSAMSSSLSPKRCASDCNKSGKFFISWHLLKAIRDRSLRALYPSGADIKPNSPTVNPTLACHHVGLMMIGMGPPLK